MGVSKFFHNMFYTQTELSYTGIETIQFNTKSHETLQNKLVVKADTDCVLNV